MRVFFFHRFGAPAATKYEFQRIQKNAEKQNKKRSINLTNQKWCRDFILRFFSCFLTSVAFFPSLLFPVLFFPSTASVRVGKCRLRTNGAHERVYTYKSFLYSHYSSEPLCIRFELANNRLKKCLLCPQVIHLLRSNTYSCVRLCLKFSLAVWLSKCLAKRLQLSETRKMWKGKWCKSIQIELVIREKNSASELLYFKYSHWKARGRKQGILWEILIFQSKFKEGNKFKIRNGLTHFFPSKSTSFRK